MRNNSKNADPDITHDYSPNELGNLASSNPELYREIVESNLNEGDTIEDWQQRNMDRHKRWDTQGIY